MSAPQAAVQPTSRNSRRSWLKKIFKDHHLHHRDRRSSSPLITATAAADPSATPDLLPPCSDATRCFSATATISPPISATTPAKSGRHHHFHRQRQNKIEAPGAAITSSGSQQQWRHKLERALLQGPPKKAMGMTSAMVHVPPDDDENDEGGDINNDADTEVTRYSSSSEDDITNHDSKYIDGKACNDQQQRGYVPVKDEAAKGKNERCHSASGFMFDPDSEDHIKRRAAAAFRSALRSAQETLVIRNPRDTI